MAQEYTEYTKKEVKKFAKDMIESYNKQNLINSFCTIVDFNDKGSENFIQVGERINLPKEFFKEEKGVEKYNTPLAEDFIRSLVNGEKDFILKELLDSKEIKSTSISSFCLKELTEAVSKFDNPTDIFFPIERFHNRVYSFVYEGSNPLKFESGKEATLSINGKQLTVHWILSFSEIKKIIIINKKELNIIQKKFEDAKDIKGISPIKEFEELSKNQKLMLYLCEKKDDSTKFDFTFRTVISKPELNENSAFIIEVDE